MVQYDFTHLKYLYLKQQNKRHSQICAFQKFMLCSSALIDFQFIHIKVICFPFRSVSFVRSLSAPSPPHPWSAFFLLGVKK